MGFITSAVQRAGNYFAVQMSSAIETIVADDATTYFDIAKNLLLNPSQKAQEIRREYASMSAAAKGISGVATGVAGLFSLIGLVTAVSHPVLGGFLFLPSAFLTLTARELFVVSGNAHEIIRKKQGTTNASELSSTLFKNTWIAGSIFESSVVSFLETPI